jgi:thiosulfate/3-mercaptopyruvate sulfurtransferase
MHTTLIDAATLSQHLEDPNWVILDCRHDLLHPNAGLDSFAIGHIAGAQFANIDTDLSGAKIGADGKFQGRHPLPGRAALIETLRGWGMFAARVWWLLRWVGHPAVAVLDGGLVAWQAQGLAMVTHAERRTPGTISDKPSLVSTVSAEDVAANLATQGGTVVDARAPDRYRGENETIDPVGGHIPGAKNRFFKDNLAADGRFKSAEELKADFAPLFESAPKAIMQCGSGVTACHNLLAMEIAGLPGAALYPGSWSEWVSDPSRPVGAGPN